MSGNHLKKTPAPVESRMVVEKVDDIIKRLSGHRGVRGVVVCDKEGSPMRTTLDNTSTTLYSEGIRHLGMIATSMVRDVDPSNELMFIRIGTKKLEMMATLDPEYTALVIQDNLKSNI